MVSYSHLSAGNSESSRSRDLFAEYGISRPNSPSLSSPLVLSCEDMAESDAIPQVLTISSDESTSPIPEAQEINVGPALSSEAQDIFKAAQFFSRKDRDEALSERKMNMQLLNFISAHGFSVKDVNSYVLEGKTAVLGLPNADQMFDNTSSDKGEPSGVKLPFFGGTLVPESCVGEDSLPALSTLRPTHAQPLLPVVKESGPLSEDSVCAHLVAGASKS